MKKIGVVVIVVVLLSFLVGLISCGGEQPSQTGPVISPEPTQTTQPTKEEPIVLKYGDVRAWKDGYFGTPGVSVPWSHAIEAVSDGRLVLDVYDAGSLLSYPLAEFQTSEGVADICFAGRIQKGLFPMKDVLRLPPQYGESTAMENLMIHWFVLWDYFKKDHEEMNLIEIAPIHLAPSIVITSKKPVNTMADLKGLTLMSTDAPTIQLLTGVGAIVIPVPTLSGYEALQKGTADGGVWDWNGPFVYGWTDAFDPGYYVDVGGVVRSGGSTNAMMNLDKWNSLPADLQEILLEVSWRWEAVYFAGFIDATIERFKPHIASQGIQYIVWSDAEKAKLVTEKEKIINEWPEKMEDLYGRGDEAAALLKLYNEAAQNYVPPAPFPQMAELALSPEQADEWETEWNKVYGPGSNWGMDYKAYPNQTGLHELEGGVFQSW